MLSSRVPCDQVLRGWQQTITFNVATDDRKDDLLCKLERVIDRSGCIVLNRFLAWLFWLRVRLEGSIT